MTRPILAFVILVALLLSSGALAGEKNQSFAVVRGGMLEVHADAGEITVRGWEKDEVSVRVQSLSDEQLKAVSFSQSGGTVTVEFRWNRRKTEEMKFDISVPSSFNCDVRTAGGDLALQGPLTGTLKGSTAGGSITVGSVGGTIAMETAGGEITCGEIAGDLTCKTAGGDISVKNVSGAANLSTAGGSIEVGNVGKNLQASTAGGDISAGKVGGEVKVSTAGGSIKIHAGQGRVSLSTAGGNIALASARGVISASTSGGNVELDNIEGSVTARSSAGNVDVALTPSSDGSSVLTTSAGNVVLRIAPSARATISARNRGPFSEDEEGDGGITSDFPVTRPAGKHGNSRVEVILNGGGHTIKLETMVGTILIKKAK